MASQKFTEQSHPELVKKYLAEYSRREGKIGLREEQDSKDLLTVPLASLPEALKWLNECYVRGQKVEESQSVFFLSTMHEFLVECASEGRRIDGLQLMARSAAKCFGESMGSAGMDATVMKCAKCNPKMIEMEGDWAKFSCIPFRELLAEDRNRFLTLGVMDFVFDRLIVHYAKCNILQHQQVCTKKEFDPFGGFETEVFIGGNHLELRGTNATAAYIVAEGFKGIKAGRTDQQIKAELKKVLPPEVVDDPKIGKIFEGMRKDIAKNPELLQSIDIKTKVFDTSNANTPAKESFDQMLAKLKAGKTK